MANLTGSERKFLRGLAHHLKPQVMVGKNGISETLVESLNQALEAHELIKLRFIGHKEERKALSQELAVRSNSEVVGLIGHTAVFFRQHLQEDKRRIHLPS
ncbi:MAG: ribosome assembly RNA-binding protein YhbY [Acidobacteriota bacterium]